jgi:hypothetical protein
MPGENSRATLQSRHPLTTRKISPRGDMILEPQHPRGGTLADHGMRLLTRPRGLRTRRATIGRGARWRFAFAERVKQAGEDIQQPSRDESIEGLLNGRVEIGIGGQIVMGIVASSPFDGLSRHKIRKLSAPLRARTACNSLRDIVHAANSRVVDSLQLNKTTDTEAPRLR